MQFVDLATQQDLIHEDVRQRIEKVLTHGRYIMGPEIVEMEELLADFVGVKHCVSVASGTDALQIAMMALNIGPGDEIITTPFTFISTAETIVLLGARPVFVDIDVKSYNIDPNLIEAAITSNTKAIMPVSLYGQCADMDAINEIAARHSIPVIEDGAQSFGATYHGRQSCSMSAFGCTSFFPSKPLGAYGDGGAIFTGDDGLAKVVREIRVHGQDRRYHHPRIGINGRMDTLQAAVILAKMSLFPDEVLARARVADRYTDALSSILRTPHIDDGNTSVYAQYTLRVPDRDAFIATLKESGIPTAVHYPVPLHKQPALKYDEEFPHSELASREVVSLPMHPYLNERDQDSIIECIRRHYGA